MSETTRCADPANDHAALVGARLRAARERADLNAFVEIDDAGALSAARALGRSGPTPRRPLAGMTVCVKDVTDVASLPTTAGIRILAQPAEADTAVVVALRQAGVIVIGKGATNEFAYGIDGENRDFGPTRNPHDTDRISGGSSSAFPLATAGSLRYALRSGGWL